MACVRCEATCAICVDFIVTQIRMPCCNEPLHKECCFEIMRNHIRTTSTHCGALCPLCREQIPCDFVREHVEDFWQSWARVGVLENRLATADVLEGQLRAEIANLRRQRTQLIRQNAAFASELGTLKRKNIKRQREQKEVKECKESKERACEAVQPLPKRRNVGSHLDTQAEEEAGDSDTTLEYSPEIVCSVEVVEEVMDPEQSVDPDQTAVVVDPEESVDPDRTETDED